MTPQEINEAVARKLGWYPDDDGIYWHTPWEEKAEDARFPEDTYSVRSTYKGVKNYCQDISAAWEIVEKYPFIMIKDYRCDFLIKKAKYNFWDKEKGAFGEWIDDWAAGWICIDRNNEWVEGECIHADSATMAICLAFLKLESK